MTDFDINSTVGPLLDGTAALMPSVVSLIVAIVPAIIVLAVVGFITALLSGVLDKLKF